MVSIRTAVVVVGVGEDPARRLDPVDVGHLDVHQDDPGPPLPREVDGVPAVLGLAGDRYPGLRVEDRAKAGAHQGLVVGDEDRTG